MEGYLPRDMRRMVESALRTVPVVVVTGMRQVGKTTMLMSDEMLSGHPYVNMEEFGILEAAREDPLSFLSGYASAAIDEVQRAPFLLRALKLAVDKGTPPGAFVLSGSASLLLSSHVGETLAGRAVYLDMWPLSRRELTRATGTTPFVVSALDGIDPAPHEAFPALALGDVLRGGFPRVALEGADARTWFLGLEQTYLERDVRSLAGIRDLPDFRKFLRLVALRPGGLLNVSALCRDSAVSYDTAGKYLAVLEASHVLVKIPPYLSSRASRLVKSSKVYLSDSGLTAYLAGRLSAAPGDGLWGPLVETYVAQNLKSILSAWLPEADLCYWHVQGRHEVDFVVDGGERCLAIEVKAGARWGTGDLAGLRRFLDAVPTCVAGILACNMERTVPLGPRLFAVPLTRLLS
jgi:predicted AAA+ superfamily ATPase